MLIYLPIVSDDLETFAEAWNGHRQSVLRRREPYATLRHQGTTLGGVLSVVDRDDILFVLCHGRRSTSSQICAQTGTASTWCCRTKPVYEYLTADQLAMRMIVDGLTRDCGDIRLLICWSGMGRGAETPFAGQLSSTMKNRGFYRVVITGYTGSVEMLQSTQNVIISPGFTRKHFEATEGMLADQGNDVAGLANVGDESRSLADLLTPNGRLSGPGPNKTVWY